jgi:hypothetical protein
MKVEGSRSAFMDWFWRPPRPHGATIRDRVVTNLELFYDLAYVAVIGEAAHHLAEDVSARAIAEFAVVFAMIWFAWINGSLYLEIHGRQDGRTRTFVFLQMGILVLSPHSPGARRARAVAPSPWFTPSSSPSWAGSGIRSDGRTMPSTRP